MGMMGRGGPMGGPIGGAMSGPMGGPPPNMMGRGMPGGMAAGMGPGGWHPTLPPSALVLSPGVTLVDLAEQGLADLPTSEIAWDELGLNCRLLLRKVKEAMANALLLFMQETYCVWQSLLQGNFHLNGHMS